MKQPKAKNQKTTEKKSRKKPQDKKEEKGVCCQWILAVLGPTNQSDCVLVLPDLSTAALAASCRSMAWHRVHDAGPLRAGVRAVGLTKKKEESGQIFAFGQRVSQVRVCVLISSLFSPINSRMQTSGTRKVTAIAEYYESAMTLCSILDSMGLLEMRLMKGRDPGQRAPGPAFD
ncbi:hypothetical protein EJ05DRAFT_365808 [Pseudovirgaria hyperparasitica]|uniref:Uncharacterized protein n=1 Tax=Pseudovirgaria hyperparasitica TaxID=470096 RepID=A0A6A6WB40_9PEZI|nr:uncharacterized protein EJ05DRAFT_365808 [Pseudovirgaria hyperparasitica]KAF2758817.1 hypothetical protein EJ05DRAFT_365808 [Pseudovirgaria hyperparasitica]